MRHRPRIQRFLLVIAATGVLVISTAGAAVAAPEPDPTTGRMPFTYNDPAFPWTPLTAEWIGGPPLNSAAALDQFGSVSAAVLSSACDEVFGTQSDLVKQATRTNNADGTVTLKVQLTTSLPPGETRLRDCVWIDSTPNSQWDSATEALFAVDIQPATFLPDPTTLADDSLIRFRVTLTAAATDRVCDQGARSDYQDAIPPQSPYTERSNTLCLDSPPDPLVPEAPVVALISLSALVVLGGTAVWVRRQAAFA